MEWRLHDAPSNGEAVLPTLSHRIRRRFLGQGQFCWMVPASSAASSSSSSTSSSLVDITFSGAPSYESGRVYISGAVFVLEGRIRRRGLGMWLVVLANGVTQRMEETCVGAGGDCSYDFRSQGNEDAGVMQM